MGRPILAPQGRRKTYERKTYDLPLVAQLLRERGLPVVSVSTDDPSERQRDWPGFVCVTWQHPVWRDYRREAERLTRARSHDHRLPSGGNATREDLDAAA